MSSTSEILCSHSASRSDVDVLSPPLPPPLPLPSLPSLPPAPPLTRGEVSADKEREHRRLPGPTRRTTSCTSFNVSASVSAFSLANEVKAAKGGRRWASGVSLQLGAEVGVVTSEEPATECAQLGAKVERLISLAIRAWSSSMRLMRFVMS